MIINRFMVMERLKELTDIKGQPLAHNEYRYLEGQLAESLYWLEIAERADAPEIEYETKSQNLEAEL